MLRSSSPVLHQSGMPLAMARPGEEVRCAGFAGGHGSQRRLMDMGLAPGTALTVISGAGSPGPVVVRVGDTRLVLGRGLAQRVLVEPVPSEPANRAHD